MSLRSRAPGLPFFAMLVFAISLVASCSSRDEARRYKPSEVSSRVSDSVMAHVRSGDIFTLEQFNGARTQYAAALVDSMAIDSLIGDEILSCANVLSWSGDNESAKKMLSDLVQADDSLSQEAFVNLITIVIEDDDLSGGETLLKEYRQKYSPDPESGIDLYLVVDELARRYNNNARPEDAARVVIDEIDYLGWEYPHPSFFLVEELLPLMTETGRVEELRELSKSYLERARDALSDHLAKPVPADSTAEDYDKITDGFNSRIEYLEGLRKRVDLIGKRAPALNTLHVFNTDSTFTLDRDLGKITILDFWATWCISCVVGYGELRDLLNEYGEDQLAVVGITNFQKYFRDPDSGEREGSKKEPLSEKRELELTADFIKGHGITWPCLITDVSASESRYSAAALPTYVILDRDGVIRYMQMGIGKPQQMRRVIEMLRNVD